MVIYHVLEFQHPRFKVYVFSSQVIEQYFPFICCLNRSSLQCICSIWIGKNISQALLALKFRYLSKFTTLLSPVQWCSNPNSIPYISSYYFTSASSYCWDSIGNVSGLTLALCFKTWFLLFFPSADENPAHTPVFEYSSQVPSGHCACLPPHHPVRGTKVDKKT